MPQISLNVTLGRIAMAHTAKPGLHLQQDEATGLWLVASHTPQTSLAQRLVLAAQSLRSNKWFFAVAAGVAGVSLALVASSYTVPSYWSNSPALAIKAAAQPTSSIAMEPAEYALPLPVNAPALPALMNPGPVPPVAYMPDAGPLPSNDPAPVLGRSIPSKASAAPRSVSADAPLAVFNEPLQPKSAPSNATTAQQPSIVTQLVQPRAGSVALVASTPAVVKQTPPPKAVPAPAAAPAEVPIQPSTTTADSRAHILAVPNAESIVVTNPSTRLPMMVKLGEKLPDGSTLKSIDKNNSSAITSRGETLSLR